LAEPRPAGSSASSTALTINLIAQIAYGLVAMTVCLPSMPDWSGVFGRPQDQVQLTFSGFVLTFGLLQLVYGPLSDRYGRRAMILSGLAVCIAGSVLAALAHSLPLLVAARVLQGAGAAAGMVVGRAAVQDLFHGPQRTRVMAYVGMTLGLCPPAGTLIGGQIHEALGWQANFVGVAALGVLLFAAAWWRLPRRPASPTPTLTTITPASPAGGLIRGSGSRAIGSADPVSRASRATGALSILAVMGRAYAKLLRMPVYLLHVAILGFTTAAFYMFLSGAPLVLRSYGVGAGEVGLYIMVVPLSYIVGNFLTSRLVQRRGGPRLMRLGQAFSLAGTLLMLSLGLAGLHTPLAFALPLLLMGIGHGLLVPPCLVATVALMPSLAGAASALAGVSQQFAGALGGYLVGWVSTATHTGVAALMLGATLLASLARMAAVRAAAR
jgi:DHA1 family bicyclomycin/chloramphenicol resistance-like MFS transporter